MTAPEIMKIPIEGTVRAEAEAVLGLMGLTVSDAIRLMLTRVAEDRDLPFGLLDPNETSRMAMQEAERDDLPRFDTLQDFMDDLSADD